MRNAGPETGPRKRSKDQTPFGLWIRVSRTPLILVHELKQRAPPVGEIGGERAEFARWSAGKWGSRDPRHVFDERPICLVEQAGPAPLESEQRFGPGRAGPAGC